MPLVPGLLILGPVFFAAILLVALSQASSATTRAHQENPGFSSAFTWATDVIGALWHRVVRTAISHFAAAHLIPLARWFSGLNTLVLGLLKVGQDSISTATYAVERLTGHVIPREVGKAVAPVRATANTAARDARTALAREKALGSTVSTQHAAQTRLNVHYSHAIDVAIPKQLGRINTEVDTLRTDQTKLRERTTSLENGAVKTFEWITSHPLSAVTAVFTGAVAIALQRLGWGVLRCRSWKNLGKSLTCGVGQWLTDLLALIATFALAGLSILDPEALAEAAVATVDVIEPILQEMLP